MNFFQEKGKFSKKTALLVIFIFLAAVPSLPFIKIGHIFLQIINFSAISLIAIAFEYGYGLSYFISALLSLVLLISMSFNPVFNLSYLTTIIFLNLIPLVPAYYNRTYNNYFTSEIPLLERSKISFDEFTTEVKIIKDLNASFQSQVHDILDLYEVTKKMGASLDMTEVLGIFREAVNKILKFSKMKIILIDETEKVPTATYEILNSPSLKAGSEDIHSEPPSQFDSALVKVVSARKEVIHLKPPIGQADPLKQYLVDLKELLVVLPLLSEGLPIGVLAISGIEEEQIENFLILADQLALEVKKANLYEKVQALAITDDLTGMYVRRHFLDRLNEEIARSKRHNLKLSVLMIDLDHFKRCNDTYGHLVGDIVLKEIANIIKEYVRQVDLVGRYGGEEFVIALPDTDKTSAINVAERIRQAVERDKFRAYDETITFTVSIGVATFPENDGDIVTLIDCADKALYRAKKEGRNKVISHIE